MRMSKERLVIILFKTILTKNKNKNKTGMKQMRKNRVILKAPKNANHKDVITSVSLEVTALPSPIQMLTASGVLPAKRAPAALLRGLTIK